MTTYAITRDGVLRDDGASIPNDLSNVDWRAYQAWLVAGNTPRPIQPSLLHVWNGTAWVVDLVLQARAAATSQLASDLAAVIADANIVAFVKMSPAQIDAYIDTNFPGAVAPLPNLRVTLKVLAKCVVVLARRSIAGVD